MKKALTIILAALLVNCHGSLDPGAKNAELYVIEQVPEQADNIASVEAISVDSLLSDVSFSFAEIEMLKKGQELMQGKIKPSEYDALLDSISHAATDIAYSWQFSSVVNDSLKKLPQYDWLWRRVYTVRVTMKSGVTKEPRVMMDQDGITPRMIEMGMRKALEDHTARILEALETLNSYKY